LKEAGVEKGEKMTEDINQRWMRTAYGGQLRKDHAQQHVVLFGWVHKLRDMGNLVFIDLRDREGLVQIVFPSGDKALLDLAKKLKMEYVIGIKGTVKERGEEAKNPELPTGEVEVIAEQIRVLNSSEVPPFVLTDPPQASEELRFKYRYLDLRRPAMQRNMKLRHQASLCLRNFLAGNGFYEIETPFLTKSTPEGARDYLVPSREYKGRFFALPQSPQIFKQILMIAGFERYFQIVRCFRDEDLRADRQPEFTQVDIEMSFIDRETLFALNEAMMASLFRIIGVEVAIPFPRLSYRDSLDKYGSDKPDLRFGMEMRNLSDLGPSLDSEVINRELAAGAVLKALVLEGAGIYSRKQVDELNLKAQELGGKGVIWIKKKEGLKSALKLAQGGLERIWEACGASDNDLVLLVADKRLKAERVLGGLREDYIRTRGAESSSFSFVWVTDFPLFEWSGEEKRLVSMHHPFTSPIDEDIDLLEKSPEQVRAQAYDLVLNGSEIGGGSLRIHRQKIQKKIFDILGFSPAEAKEKFGFFLDALQFGTPPHGGIALGFDRIVMHLAGENSIREVIPFPKTTSSLCLMTDSPSTVDKKQLDELGIIIKD
jgi:aspartyl-tRNA synthetase